MSAGDRCGRRLEPRPAAGQRRDQSAKQEKQQESIVTFHRMSEAVGGGGHGNAGAIGQQQGFLAGNGPPIGQGQLQCQEK